MIGLGLGFRLFAYAAAAMALVLAGYVFGQRIKNNEWLAKWTQRELDIVKAHDKQLTEYIVKANNLQGDLDAISAQSAQYRTALANAADAAALSRHAADAAQRGLRLATAAHAAATRAAVEAAGVATQCAPAVEASDLLVGLLARFDDLAGRVDEAASTVGLHADDTFGRASECAARYDAARERMQ
jgi:hypothetical protein